MGEAIGIDLGTTNFCAGYLKNGKSRVLLTTQSEPITPSVVLYNARKDRFLTGRQAWNGYERFPNTTVFSIMRLVGYTFNDVGFNKVNKVQKMFGYPIVPSEDLQDPDLKIQLGSYRLSPVDILTMLLARVKVDASRTLNNSEVTHAVIAVPAYFSERQRAAIRVATEKAGLIAKKIIDKPVAVSLAYGIEPTSERHRILVYDMGGGTFNVSLLQTIQRKFQILSIEGDSWLGGDDFDMEIVQRLLSWVQRNEGVNLANDKSFLIAAKKVAEQTKILLSGQDKAEIYKDFRTNTGRIITVDMEISRQEFENWIHSYVDRSLRLVHKLLNMNHITLNDLTTVLLVGGATKIPLIRESIYKLFGKDKVRLDLDPLQSVAMGAGILAARLALIECPQCKFENKESVTKCEKCGQILQTIAVAENAISTNVMSQPPSDATGQGQADRIWRLALKHSLSRDADLSLSRTLRSPVKEDDKQVGTDYILRSAKEDDKQVRIDYMGLLREKLRGEVSRSFFQDQDSDAERVNSIWKYIQSHLYDLDIESFHERTETLVHHFCKQTGLKSLSNETLLSKQFCRFVLDISNPSMDIGLPNKLPVVCSINHNINEDDFDKLYHVVRDVNHRGRLIIFLILFSEQTVINEAHELISSSRLSRQFDIVVLGRLELQRLIYAQNPKDVLHTTILRNVDLIALSPFQRFGPASENTFSGREYEISTIVGNVHEKSYAVIGGRLIGKTSLLNQLHCQYLPKAGFQTLFYDCGMSPYSEFLSTYPGNWSNPPPENAPSTFVELLTSPPTDKPLVLLLDEVEELIRGDASANWPLFKRIRSLVNGKQLQVIICGSTNLRLALQDSRSPLYNLTKNVLPIGRLEYPAVKELITRPMRQLQIDLTREKTVVDLIWRHTGGHPCVVQRLCVRLIEKTNSQSLNFTVPRRHISPDDVDSIIQDPGFLSNDFIAVHLEQATYLERIIILVLAQTETLPLSIRDIRVLLLEQTDVKFKLREVQAALDRLTELRCVLKNSLQGYLFDISEFPRALQKPNVVTVRDLLERYVEDYQDYGDTPLRHKYKDLT